MTSVRTGTQHIATITGLVSVALLASAASAQQAPTAQPAGSTIVVDVRAKSARGAVVCRLYGPESERTFPRRAAQPRVTVRVGLSSANARCVFNGVLPGPYAVGVYQDENNNGQLDTGIFGIPVEPMGVSNNVRPLLGPPSFNDARFVHTGGQRVLEVRL